MTSLHQVPNAKMVDFVSLCIDLKLVSELLDMRVCEEMQHAA